MLALVVGIPGVSFPLASSAHAHETTARSSTEPEDPEPTSSSDPAPRPPRPPRIDGAYVGTMLFGGASLVRVNDLDTDGAFATFGGWLRGGQMVLPWLGLGIAVGGLGGARSESGARQTLGEGGILVEGQFVPVPRIPFSLRVGFGFGAGAVMQEGRSGREGFGGALFQAAARYEFFPGAARYRPERGGGFGIGPEIGWLGATPATADGPMAHALYLGLSATWYFGE